MTKIILDGNEMKDKKLVHLYLKHQFDNNEYYGSNLDALWDVLMSYNKPVKVILLNKNDLIDNLNEYGEHLLNVFIEASEENRNILFELQ